MYSYITYKHTYTGVKIYGVDINSECKAFAEEDDIDIFIGDQSNKTFMQSVVDTIGVYDVCVCVCIYVVYLQRNL